ncbi:hypothetical protein PIB30_011445 [Stylosanthes scabra]|uniref:F-box associated beta-propeller type 1 domain-containing protein n=1 Tax=Stylosanthes scabra TaxID=79078 RepID=A0ABU6Q5T6_9FABA|nr:hypothetical protein [Stylosanthes scabra]
MIFRADLETRSQVQLNIPININQGMYTMVGSNHGILYLKLSQAGHHSRLMVWNPLTSRREYVFDEVKKRFNYKVCIYTFGFLADSMDYRVVHVYKRNFEDPNMSWTIYDPKKLDWSESISFKSCVSKLGPKHIIEKGVVHWIGWGGQELADPLKIITFDMNVNEFYEIDVPFHVLTNYNGHVGFVTQTRVELGIGIMYNPTMILGKDVFSVIETHGRFGCSNDAQRTEVIISKHKQEKDNPENLMSRT